MSKTLFIVESPGKIKKIQSILGKEYIVDASVGHVLTIPKNGMNIDVHNNFEPVYEIKRGKYRTKVRDLKRLVKRCKFVILAMDEDREGEAIAQGLVTALNLKKGDYKRVVFNAITRKAIMDGINNMREMDYNLVDAQKARSVLDKYIGYSLSPCLWKSVVGKGLSAGRVQSIVGRIIIDREKEIGDFFEADDCSFYKVKGEFKKMDTSQLLNKKDNKVAKISGDKKMNRFMNKCVKSQYIVQDVYEKKGVRNPSPPFITSTLQQEASNKFKFGVKQTMAIAQRLYEKGHITYMRTDSTMICKEAMKEIKKYVIGKWGKQYYRKKVYKSKVKNAQEAHEAIRPTHIDQDNLEEGLTRNEKMLYSLIWKRTVASQMAPADILKMYINIEITKVKKYYFQTMYEQIVFDGFLIVWDVKDGGLKKIKVSVGDNLKMVKIIGKQDYNKPPSRYTEASMISYLEKMGIGRPSTYSSMVEKVCEKKYAEKKNVKGVEKECKIIELCGKTMDINETNGTIMLGKENKKLVGTKLGFQVIEYLMEHFDKIMDYKFTANMEDEFDDISNGKIIWHKVLNNFNKSFSPKVEKEMGKTNVGKNNNDKTELGVDKETNQVVQCGEGRYGPYVKMGKKTASIVEPLTLETITLDKALELLKYPLLLGKYKRKNVVLRNGKNGLYIVWGDVTVSVKDEELDIDLDNAKELLDKHIVNEFVVNKKKKYIVMNGDYGYYVRIVNGKKKYNVSLPKNVNANEIDANDIEQIIDGK